MLGSVSDEGTTIVADLEAGIGTLTRLEDAAVDVTVVVVEPTGSETQVFAKFGNDLVDALVKDRIHAAPGSEIGFVIDPADVHLFDHASQQRI